MNESNAFCGGGEMRSFDSKTRELAVTSFRGRGRSRLRELGRLPCGATLLERPAELRGLRLALGDALERA